MGRYARPGLPHHTQLTESIARARPAGWLGLLLGSRLYFRVCGRVLADAAAYEAVVDDVAQEVRRLAPSPAASAAQAPPPAAVTLSTERQVAGVSGILVGSHAGSMLYRPRSRTFSRVRRRIPRRAHGLQGAMSTGELCNCSTPFWFALRHVM